MDTFGAEVRAAERVAFCRCCDKPIEKGQTMVSWYSYRNRGMNIHICLPCAREIGEMAK
jgi:hypothetical protein